VNRDGVARTATLGSVANAARALKSFTNLEPEWGVSDLARRLGVAKSTTHRVLATLTDEGLLEQNADSGRYRLGLAVFDLAAAVQSLDLHEAAMAAMTDLRNRTGETVQLAVLDGREVVYVERLDSPNLLRLFRDLGRRNSAHSSASGKALLAFSPPEAVDRLLRSWKLRARTPHTITTVTALRAELSHVRERGYACNRNEYEIGVVSVAAPIHDASGTTVAAVSVAGPSSRLDPIELQVAQATMETAALISRRLGFRSTRGAT